MARIHTSIAFGTALGVLALVPVAHARGRANTDAAAVKGPQLTATLVEPEKKAAEKEATVRVQVHGIKIVDPAQVKERPHKGEGHLHYRVDDGPVIATTATKLSFHELTPGSHRIQVVLAANDHKPLGPEQTVNVTIP